MALETFVTVLLDGVTSDDGRQWVLEPGVRVGLAAQLLDVARAVACPSYCEGTR